MAYAQSGEPAAESRPQGMPLNRGGKAGLGAIASTDERIAALQNQVRERTNDFARYDQLGSAYFQKARETGDIS